MDQFIFDIEKAEVFSESFISNYSFSVGTVNYEKEVNQAHQNDQSDGESTESDQEQPTSETVTHEIGKVTVTLAIESPSYEHLVEFLSRIERVDRVTKVDNIAFNGPSELQAEISADEDKEEEQILSYTVTISTFFLPELGQYLDTEPMIPYPKPSDKENPLLIN